MWPTSGSEQVDPLVTREPRAPSSGREARYAPTDVNLESDEEVDAWIRQSSHSGEFNHRSGACADNFQMDLGLMHLEPAGWFLF